MNKKPLPVPRYNNAVILQGSASVDFTPEQLQSDCLPQIRVTTHNREYFKPNKMIVWALVKSTFTVCPLQAIRELLKRNELQNINLTAVESFDFLGSGKPVTSIPCEAFAIDYLGGGISYPIMSAGVNATWVFEPTSRLLEQLYGSGRLPVVISLEFHVMISGPGLK